MKHSKKTIHPVRYLLSTVVVTMGLITLIGSGGGGGAFVDTGGITLTVSADSPHDVSLEWTDSRSSIQLPYTIDRNDSLIDFIGRFSYIDDSVEPLTHYCYEIRSGGSVSNRACVTTPGTTGWAIETIDTGTNPALALDPSNQPHVSYRNNSGVMLATNSGANWQQSVVDSAAGNIGDTDVAVDPANADRLSYADDVNDRLMHASNLSGPWITEIADTAVGLVNALSIDAAGNAHMVYDSDEANDGVLSYVTNASGSWLKERLAAYPNASIRDVDILVDSTGVVHVAYIVTGFSCSVHYLNNQGGTWQREIIENRSNCGTAIAIDSTGVVHIVYSVLSALMHAHNSGGSWQSEQIDSFASTPSDRVGLAIDGADRLHIAYQDTFGNLKYATNVSGMWEYHFLDSKGDTDVGGYPSITVDSAGRVTVVYIDWGDGTIKLVSSP